VSSAAPPTPSERRNAQRALAIAFPSVAELTDLRPTAGTDPPVLYGISVNARRLTPVARPIGPNGATF
jgi:hypothetical protein